MILGRNGLLDALARGWIVIKPEPVKIGTNSIDLRLGDTLFTYGPGRMTIDGVNFLDPKQLPELLEVPKIAVPDPQNIDKIVEAWPLVPGRLYLGATHEWTSTSNLVPWIDGRSSLGRLGISVHVTAGRGDVGFSGKWTLEIFVVEPVLLYCDDVAKCQVTYFQVSDELPLQSDLLFLASYEEQSSSYVNAQDTGPVGSRLYKQK